MVKAVGQNIRYEIFELMFGYDMFEKFKNKFVLQLRKIEINYQSWKNAQDIAKAYSKDVSLKTTFSAFIETHLRKIIIYSSILMIGLVLTAGVWVTIVQVKKGLYTVSVKKTTQKTSISNVLVDTRKKIKLEQQVSDKTGSIVDTQNSKNIVLSLPNKTTEKIQNVSTIVKKDSKSSFIDRMRMLFSKLNYRTVAVSDSQQKKSVTKKRDSQVVVKETQVFIPVDTPKVQADTVPSQNIQKKSTIKAEYFMLVANKANHLMYLLHQNENQDWKVVKEFEIAIGGGLTGPKVFAGDRRTPEGLYFILLKKDKSELSSIYGPLAYVLNYPNNIDVKAGRTGQGIWIHGTSGEAAPVSTKGCLSLANKNIVELLSYLEDGKGTPVLIVNDSTLSDPVAAVDYKDVDNKRIQIFSTQNQLLASVNTFLSEWVNAWETRDISLYQQFYSVEHFNSQGMNWGVWKEKKKQTFQAYNSIDVTVKNVKLSDWSDDSIEVKFLQNYRSDQKYFENGKKLFLEKDSGKWKITREITIPKEELLL